MKCLPLAAVLAGLLASPLAAAESAQGRAEQLLRLVNASYQALYKVSSEAQWLAATDVTREHDAASEIAGKASAAFNGNPVLIRETQELLRQKSKLKPVTARELEWMVEYFKPLLLWLETENRGRQISWAPHLAALRAPQVARNLLYRVQKSPMDVEC